MTVRGAICVLVELLFLIVSLGTGIRELLVVAICLGAVIAYSFLSVLLSVLTLNTLIEVCVSLVIGGSIALAINRVIKRACKIA